MDIKEIDEFLTALDATFKEEGAKPGDDILSFVTAQLLLHIYRKLEDIDNSLGSIYNQLTDIEQSLPSKW